jgi:hypothetical protein
MQLFNIAKLSNSLNEYSDSSNSKGRIVNRHSKINVLTANSDFYQKRFYSQIDYCFLSSTFLKFETYFAYSPLKPILFGNLTNYQIYQSGGIFYLNIKMGACVIVSIVV